MQSQPVQRTMVGQPFAQRGDSAMSGPGVVPSQYGIEASGWFDDVVNAVKTVAQVAPTVAQGLGAFGI